MEIIPTNPLTLGQHPLFRSMDTATQASLLDRFVMFTVAPHEVLIRSGENDTSMLLLLAGSAEVFVRRGPHRYRVARIHAGEVLGEMAFFDPTLPRSADVIEGDEPGVIGLLHADVYKELVSSGDPAAEVIEKIVLDSLAQRMKATNVILGELLGQHRRGGMLDALGRMFGRKEVAHRPR